jgi:glucosamine-6-phosphate isomerase
MNLKIFSTYEDLSAATAQLIVDQIRIKPHSLLCFPSGDSPTGTLALLVKYAAEGRVDLSKCTFVGLDEWVGMDRNDAGGCQHYLYQHFFTPAQVAADRILFFDAKATDLQRECKRIDDFLSRNGPIDLVVVGIGINGHIGLNEPGASPGFKAQVIDLAPETKTSAEKYFENSKKPEKGITLGLSQLMDAQTLVLIASGEKKAEIIKNTVEGPVTNKVPASHLQEHRHSYIFLDRAAASMITVS